MKKIFFMFAVLMFAAVVVGVPIPMAGNVSVNMQVTQAKFGASFGGVKVSSANGVFDWKTDAGQVGSAQVQFSFSDFSGGEVQLKESGQRLGLAVSAVDNTLTIVTFPFSFSSSMSEWSQTSDSLEKQLTYALIKDNNTVGTMRVLLSLAKSSSAGTVSGFVFVGAEKAGSFSRTTQAVTLLDNVNLVTNYFAGFVRSKNDRAITGGQVFAQSTNGRFTSRIQPIGDRGGYGLRDEPFVVQGLLGSQIKLFVDADLVNDTVMLTSDTKVRRVDLITSREMSGTNFPDADFDGVPDSLDQCPSSVSSVVNQVGCTCDQLQKLQPGASCVFSQSTGPSVSPVPLKSCDAPKSCLGTQDFCTENKTVIKNCVACGCPNGFECNPCPEGKECIEDGGCYKTVETVGLKCLKNEYKAGAGLDCTTLGPTWYDFLGNDPLKRDMNSFIGAQVDENVFVDTQNIENDIKGDIHNLKVCINTQDLGCVPDGTKCPGEDVLANSKQSIGSMLTNEVRQVLAGGSSISKSGSAGEGTDLMASQTGYFPFVATPLLAIVGAIGGAFFGDVDVSFYFHQEALDDVSLRVPYSCDPLLITPEQSCKSVVQNGDEASAIDVVFVGDGFTNELQWNQTMSDLLDYNGSKAGSQKEGLFSREPLKSNKKRFNVWSVMTTNISHVVNELYPELGSLPDAHDVAQSTRGCSQKDVVIVVSKDANYASDCSEGQPCLLSLTGEPFAGRQLLRLVGKWFGLADEFFMDTTQKDVSESVESFDRLSIMKSVNCKENLGAAREGWGRLKTAGKIVSFFDGCGGKCDSTCASYVRPTFNSVMNDNTKRCTTSCVNGPPFDPFYIVNEQELLVKLKEFGVSAENESTRSIQ